MKLYWVMSGLEQKVPPPTPSTLMQDGCLHIKSNSCFLHKAAAAPGSMVGPQVPLASRTSLFKKPRRGGDDFRHRKPTGESPGVSGRISATFPPQRQWEMQFLSPVVLATCFHGTQKAA